MNTKKTAGLKGSVSAEVGSVQQKIMHPLSDLFYHFYTWLKYEDANNSK